MPLHHRGGAPGANAFIDPLREVATRERILRYGPLPYSPLR
jgi:hypothetical protein